MAAKIKPIEWAEPRESNQEVPYNHVIGTTPLGTFRITWKGWKSQPSYDVDDTPWDWLGSECSLEDAKQLAQDTYESKVRACLIEDSE